jgi:ubiquitin-conjugating enzyme E2 C
VANWAAPTSSLYTLNYEQVTNEMLSASPLNGQAAELWDKDQDEFKRHVLARHRDLSDDEA